MHMLLIPIHLGKNVPFVADDIYSVATLRALKLGRRRYSCRVEHYFPWSYSFLLYSSTRHTKTENSKHSYKKPTF